MTPNLDFFVYQNRFSFFFKFPLQKFRLLLFFSSLFFHCFAISRTGDHSESILFLVFFSVFSVFFKDIMYDQLHNPHNIAKLHWYFQSVYSCIQYFTMWTFLQWEKKIGASSSPYISVPLVMMLETTPVHPLHCECACDSQKTLKSTQ